MLFDLLIFASVFLVVAGSYWIDRPDSPPWTTDIHAPSIDADGMRE